MLKGALAGMSVRPILYLSSVVLVLALAYYLSTTYQSCRSHAEFREALRAAIKASGDGAAPGPVHLSQIADFQWDTAEIFVNYKPDGSTTDCPFQWDWSSAARGQLIAEDLLTVIVFLKGGRLVNYLEYRRDWADFVDVKNPYTPETAVFQVAPSSTNPYVYILMPAS